MADQNRLPNVEPTAQSQMQEKVDKYFLQKAEKIRGHTGTKLLALKGKNKIVGATLVGCVLGIYGYTMYSVRQGKMMEAFDKIPE